MSAKAVLIFCAQALFVQSALSQCTSRAAVADYANIGYGWRAPCGWDAPIGLDASWGLDGAYSLGGCGFGSPIEYSPTSGGGLAVSSASAIAPFGLSVTSENIYEGKLAAAGELPFVGTVAVEGVLPTAGSGAINHHCGDGINAMVSDKINFGAYAPSFAGAFTPAMGPAITSAYDFGLAAPALGYRAGWAGNYCGCGL